MGSAVSACAKAQQSRICRKQSLCMAPATVRPADLGLLGLQSVVPSETLRESCFDFWGRFDARFCRPASSLTSQAAQWERAVAMVVAPVCCTKAASGALLRRDRNYSLPFAKRRNAPKPYRPLTLNPLCLSQNPRF